MRWRSRRQHLRHERRRSSKSNSWWLRSAGLKRSPTGRHSPAAASHALVSRPTVRSCCPRNWRISTSGAWTSSLFQSTPTIGLLPALCTPSSRYDPTYNYWSRFVLGQVTHSHVFFYYSSVGTWPFKDIQDPHGYICGLHDDTGRSLSFWRCLP